MAGLGKIEMGLIVTTTISLGSWIFSAGILYGQIQSNTKEISVVQTRLTSVSSENNSVDSRLARIETKVDLLIDNRITK